jgi:rhodanese-related sulfurtransferase
VVREITPADFVAERAAGRDILLLDVREAWELHTSSVPGAVHIPMAELPGRLAELEPGKPVVVLCRSGIRSLQVVQFLERRGFADVANLAGGILKWSQFDPSIPAY